METTEEIFCTEMEFFHLHASFASKSASEFIKVVVYLDPFSFLLPLVILIIRKIYMLLRKPVRRRLVSLIQSCRSSIILESDKALYAKCLIVIFHGRLCLFCHYKECS